MLCGVDTEGSLGLAGSQRSSRFSEKTEKNKEDARCGGKCLQFPALENPFVCHPRGWAFQCLLLDRSVIFCVAACISLNFCFGSTCVNFFDQSYFLFLCSCSSRFWPGGWLLFSLDTPWAIFYAHLIVICLSNLFHPPRYLSSALWTTSFGVM